MLNRQRPNADREWNALCLIQGDRDIVDGLEQPVCHFGNFLRGRIGKDYNKLFPTPAPDDIVGAHMGAHSYRRLLTPGLVEYIFDALNCSTPIENLRLLLILQSILLYCFWL